MKKNPSINDLERLDPMKLTERQELRDQLVENWGASRDLADFIVWQLVTAGTALKKSEKEKADLEANLESQEFPE
jgi:hypothetical protein